MYKKIVSLLMVLTLTLSTVLPVFAGEITDFSEESLRISDEFAAQFPGGVFNLSGVKIETHEYSGRTVMNVVRQGGAAGDVEVTVKAIDISAKYGKDYRLSIPSFIFERPIQGDEESPTILENGDSTVTGNVDENTDENVNESINENADENVDESIDGNTDESVNESVNENTDENVDESIDENADENVDESIDENADENGEGLENEPGPVSKTVSEGVYRIIGDTEVAAPKGAGLRAAREQATGQESDREKLAIPGSGPNEDQMDAAMAAANDFYAKAPGTVFTLSFKDGERVKSFNLDIIDDDIPEAEEQIVFVITDVSEGGFLGFQKETQVNILDDEPYESPAIGFSQDEYIASSGDMVQVTFKRSGGIHYYAGANIISIGQSAVAGADYEEVARRIMFIPGQEELSIKIPVTGNTSPDNKSFLLRIEPDNSIKLSGKETAVVVIPGLESRQVRESGTGPEAGASLKSSLMLAAGPMTGLAASPMAASTAEASMATSSTAEDAAGMRAQAAGLTALAAEEGPTKMLGQSELISEAWHGGILWTGGWDSAHFDHPSGWYESQIKEPNMDAKYFSKESYHESYLDSVYVKYAVWRLDSYSTYYRAFVQAGFDRGNYYYYSTATLFDGMEKDWYDGNDDKDLEKKIFGRGSNDLGSSIIGKEKNDIRPYVRSYTNNYGDDFATRIYNFRFKFRKIEFDIKQSQMPKYTIDPGNPGKYNDDPGKPGNYAEDWITPGKLEVWSSAGAGGEQLKGLYTSGPQKVYMKAVMDPRYADDGWYMSGVRFYHNDTSKPVLTLAPDKDGYFTLDSDWLTKYGSYIENDKLIIQPVFERAPIFYGVRIVGTDSDVTIAGFKLNTNYVLFDLKNNDDTTYIKGLQMHEGDRLVLRGTGNGGKFVKSYRISYTYFDLNGIQHTVTTDTAADGGVCTVALRPIMMTITPILEEQNFTLNRNPQNANDFPQLSPDIEVNGATIGQPPSNVIPDIHSGQHMEIDSIPPTAQVDGKTTQYTVKWANRTGDANGNGQLDDEEVRDASGNYYKMYDYDGDGVMDADFTPVVGDNFAYKVNQINPLFYYAFVPYTTAPKTSMAQSGVVRTYEYSIRKGFTQTKDNNGVSVNKLIPVKDADVRMAGHYEPTGDPQNPWEYKGYSDITDKNGKFSFNVNNLIDYENYSLMVDYQGNTYVGYKPIGTSLSVILPTFTSMQPLKIELALPNGGTKNTDGSVVMLQDKDAEFHLVAASLEPNVRVAKAIFRVYDQNGNLIPNPATAGTPENPINEYDRGIFSTDVDQQGRAVLDINLNFFKQGYKLKVQLQDQAGNRSAIFDTGFEFRPKPAETTVLPGFIADNEPEFPLVGRLTSALDIGVGKTVTDKNGATVTLGLGKDLDAQKVDLKEKFSKAKDSKDAGAKQAIKDANKDAPKKDDSKAKVKSSLSNNLSLQVSALMHIGYDSTVQQTDTQSAYYLKDLLLVVTLTDSMKIETQVPLPIGLSFVIRFEISGSLTGYLFISQHTDPFTRLPVKVYQDPDTGAFDYADSGVGTVNQKFDYDGGIIFEPTIALHAGPSLWGTADVTVGGSVTFYLVFNTRNTGFGTVTCKANVVVTVMGGMFTTYDKTFAEETFNLFGEEHGTPVDQMGRMASAALAKGLSAKSSESVNVASAAAARNYLENSSGWMGDQQLLQTSGMAGLLGAGASDYSEKLMMSGIYPNPDIQMARIDEDSLLMVFIGDHEERDDLNRSAVYYSISHDNGTTFSQPVLVDDDGTLDSDPRLCDLGGRILLVWSSADRVIDEDMSMEDILESDDLKMAFFDKSSDEFSEPVQVTSNTSPEGEGGSGDYHLDVDASAAYDEASGKVMILYHKVDYTSDPDEEFLPSDLGSSYPVIVYRIYDTNTGEFLPYDEKDYPEGMTAAEKEQWDKDWYGQRFLDTTIYDENLPGGKLSDPLVFDMTAGINNGKAYVAYTADMDGSGNTLEDRDVYLKTYDFANDTWTQAFKMSDMEEEAQAKIDGKPGLVVYDGHMYLFFCAGTAIHYYDVDSLFAELNSPDRAPIVIADDPETEQNEEYYYDPDDHPPLAPRVALEESHENLPIDDYQALVGDDGRMYLFWTEETVRLADGVEPGSAESSDPKNIFQEDKIFASMFYGKFSDGEESPTGDAGEDAGESVDTEGINSDYGKWSSKVQITEGQGDYEDIDASVMADGSLVMAARKAYKIWVDEPGYARYEDDHDNAQLVALKVTPVALPELKKDSLVFADAYPRANTPTTITATVTNKGLEPALEPTVDFYAVKNGTETLIGTGESSFPVYGGQEISVSVGWDVPGDIENINVIARLRDGGDTAVLSQIEKELPCGPGLKFDLFDLEYVAKNTFRAYLEVQHEGNRPMRDAQLVISRTDADGSLHEIKRTPLADADEELGMFVVDEGFDVANEYLADGKADINAQIVSGSDILANRSGRVEKVLPDDYREILDQVTGVELSAQGVSADQMSNSGLTLKSGKSTAIAAGITHSADVTAEEVNRSNIVVYRSSNPGVATVNDSGRITALRSGSTVVTAYAVPKIEVTEHTSDGYLIQGDILDTLSLTDCKSSSVNVSVWSGSGGGNTQPVTTVTPGTETGGSGAQPVIIEVPVTEGTGDYEADLPMDVMASGDPARKIEIRTGIATVTAPGNMLAEELGGAQNIALTISRSDGTKLPADVQAKIGDRPIIELGLEIDGKTVPWSNDAAPVTVSIPYSPSEEELGGAESIVIWYIDGAGKAVCVPNGHYDRSTGMVTFTVTHFSAYAVVYNPVSFNDAPASAWYGKAAGFIAARQITSGTGGGNYSPQARLTRGEFIVLTMRAYGIAPDTDLSNNFSDAGSTYYTGYLAAAKRLGISAGTGGNMYAPEKEITRQEMFTLLYNALKVIGQLPQGSSGKTLSDFTDAGQIEAWAKDAMNLLVETGTVGGNAGKLYPAATTTRAEMAQVLYNLLGK